MVKRLATSPHDPLGITNSAFKNQLVVVSVQYGTFYTYIPIRSTTIGKSRVARDLIAMHISWRSNSDITSVTRQTHLPKTHPVLWPEIYHTIVSSDNIGYPRMRASGESSTMKHRLLHASGPHPIPPPNDPKRLDPTSFTRKPALQTVGGGRSSIRSTTGIKIPPSICTRRSDGFWHGRKLLVTMIETSSITDTASRDPTTIVTPKSQFRTCPSDHGKAPSNIAP
ncbi:hypothetical protein F511_26065 [Dorcoceras hygrometricum]|uniref:Uncharacterized protein n=1 Tax=Dorcoceras hygrometricum TaxID=472368 RepID=A0A2Z7B8D4_9LAMI|nr:hypothetical protein F511_26065 [Dorcoceras hygrometricum]